MNSNVLFNRQCVGLVVLPLKADFQRRNLPFYRSKISTCHDNNRHVSRSNVAISAQKKDNNRGNRKKEDNIIKTNLRDGALLLGDCVMIIATEVSSERVPLESMPMLTGVLVISWLISATGLGDYTGKLVEPVNPAMFLLGPIFIAIVNAMLTWGATMLLSLTAYAYLVSNSMIDSSPLLEGMQDVNMSPQLEVAVALLITMSCWRGIAMKIRLR